MIIPQREVAFVAIPDEIRKLLIYQSDEGVYLFGYDCLQDTSAKWDIWFSALDEAKEYCQDVYKIDAAKWITVSAPVEHCQHDFIMPTRVIGRDKGIPQYGKFQTLIDDKWVDNTNSEKYLSLAGLTGNERLFVTGFIYEFETAKKHDIHKARRILEALEFDNTSIEQVL